MPAPTDPKLKDAIKTAYVNSNLSTDQLAEQFNVSDRTIERWIASEKWHLDRKANNVIELASRPKTEHPPIRARAVVDADSPIEIANLTISDLQGMMVSGMPGKDKAAIANSLKAWVEYREKLKPRTIEQLADQVIAQLEQWQLSPRDLAIALKQRQEATKRA